MLIALPILFFTLQTSAVIDQTTTGWCSPVFANISGSVTVTCIGVDPKALKKLNQELRHYKLKLMETLSKADEWTARYHELEKRLANSEEDSAQSQKAAKLLHAGELDKAGSVLDQLLQREEKEIDQTAANHYNRALVFELQFKPADALPHLKAAFGYRPRDLRYVKAYAELLMEERDFTQLEPVLKVEISCAREALARSEPKAENELAVGLNRLGNVYHVTGRPSEAKAVYEEALDIRKRLNDKDAVENTLETAALVVNLANLADSPHAADLYETALRLYRKIDQQNPIVRPHLWLALNNLAGYYMRLGRVSDAEETFEQALRIARELAKQTPHPLPELAATLSGLGPVYDQSGRSREALDTLTEAVGLYRHLAHEDPNHYDAELAAALSNLAAVEYRTGDSQKLKESEVNSRAALDIFHRLTRAAPSAYEAGLVDALDNLGNVLSATGKPAEAVAAYEESLDLLRHSPEADQARVGNDLNNLAEDYLRLENFRKAEGYNEEALAVFYELYRENPSIAANQLARSPMCQSTILMRKTGDVSASCAPLAIAQKVASDAGLQQVIREMRRPCSLPQ